MLKGKEQKTGENNNSKPMGKGFFVVGCVIIYFLIVGIVSAAIHLPAAITKISDNSEIKNAKVVLYDGPKSLKDATDADLEKASEEKRDISLMHCVDTKVAVNGKDCYVYDTNVNNTHTWMGDYMPAEDRTPITYFDFEGKVKITVTVPNTDIEYVNIRPLKYNIKPEINTKKHTVTFTIDTPDAYTVEFNKKVERAVHIFANEIEKDVPDKDAEGVKDIGPGEWNIEDMVLEDGDTIFINTSSTALLVIKYIVGKRVTIITNNGKAIFCDHDPNVQIVMTGGELRFPKESMTGDFALNNLQRVKANKAFLGCNGFDSEVGMSTAILSEVTINEAMISRCSGEAFILADATKINYVHQFVVAKPDSFAYLITDTRVPAEQIEEFEQNSILVKQLNPLLSYKK